MLRNVLRWLHDRFDRNTLYATAVGRDKKVDELPSFKYYDKLYCLWNFIKHNSTSTYEKLHSVYPELIYEDAEYKQGFSAFHIIKFSDELIVELLNVCDSFSALKTSIPKVLGFERQ